MSLPEMHSGLLAVTPAVPTTIDSDSKMALSGMIPVVGIILVLVGILVTWAVFFRKSPKDSRARRLVDSPPPSGRRRRHRRRDHRPRPPSLAETGGLPPVRPSDSPPPTS